MHFEVLDAQTTNIHFANTITETDSVNLFDYYYIYNGAGLTVGDLNNDGLPDLFFGGNMVSSKLYLNKGDFHFQDQTAAAGLTTDAWVMGVSLVDINADGFLDIYASVAGPTRDGHSMKNLLFVHQGLDEEGIPSFVESAAAYGIDDSSFSVHSAFLDYDRDGDLDLFILTNRVDEVDKSYIHKQGDNLTAGQTIDRLYDNIGWIDSLGHPLYVYQEEGTGIIHEGYGLGLAIEDVNKDGWPDIYVANDFLPNDRLYINQQGNRFEDHSSVYLQHQTFNGMGVDIADINNDLLPDIMVLDMLPDNNLRRKSMIGGMEHQGFLLRGKANYQAQYIRNTLQVHQGIDHEGHLYFSDISQLAGVHATDWSWAPLMADFDNDGDRDIFISNGYVKDMTDLDYINYTANNSYFGTKASKVERQKSLMDALTEVKIPNFLFENTGNYQFKDVSNSAGIDVPSFSNGAIYADMDGDGDLDIISNDINAEALVYRNNTKNQHNFLKIRLKGLPKNPDAIGANIYVEHGTNRSYTYVSPTRGYLSSMLGVQHIGLGKDTIATSLTIVWPDGMRQVLSNIAANQTLTITYNEDLEADPDTTEKQSKPIFKQTSPLIDHRHVENPYDDFLNEPLLLHMYSQQGPCLSVGTIDQKAGEDVFVGGSHGHAPHLFLQDEQGRFFQKDFPEGQEVYEDVASLLVDVDNDQDLDLYVVSGGSEFVAESASYQDRLYLNDGQGNYTLSQSLPKIRASGGCIASSDMDHDGDIDLFVGGRYAPGSYPSSPQSYLLHNEQGKFSDQASQIEGLADIGMVSSAVWSDYDQDGWDDLILVGEWMPLTIFRNDQGRLKKVDLSSLAQSNGLWNVIKAADIDKDGDMDFIAGNIGLNQDYHASPDRPFYVFADDFDQNGKIDPIFACYMKDKVGGDYGLFPFHGRDDLNRQIVAYKRIFTTYRQYAEATLNQVIPTTAQDTALVLEAHRFASTLFVNLGKGKFDMQALSREAQFGPINDLLIKDINQDGHLDVIAVGNSQASETTYGWHDASVGICLLGNDDHTFRAMSPEQSGLFLKQTIQAIAPIQIVDQAYLLLGVNDGQLISLRQSSN